MLGSGGASKLHQPFQNKCQNIFHYLGFKKFQKDLNSAFEVNRVFKIKYFFGFWHSVRPVSLRWCEVK